MKKPPPTTIISPAVVQTPLTQNSFGTARQLVLDAKNWLEHVNQQLTDATSYMPTELVTILENLRRFLIRPAGREVFLCHVNDKGANPLKIEIDTRTGDGNARCKLLDTYVATTDPVERRRAMDEYLRRTQAAVNEAANKDTLEKLSARMAKVEANQTELTADLTRFVVNVSNELSGDAMKERVHRYFEKVRETLDADSRQSNDMRVAFASGDLRTEDSIKADFLKGVQGAATEPERAVFVGHTVGQTEPTALSLDYVLGGPVGVAKAVPAHSSAGSKTDTAMSAALKERQAGARQHDPEDRVPVVISLDYAAGIDASTAGQAYSSAASKSDFCMAYALAKRAEQAEAEPAAPRAPDSDDLPKATEWMRLPDGSGCCVMSFPLPKDHWLYADHLDVPPMPGRTVAKFYQQQAEAITAAARYAIRAATMRGKETDFDPDAMVRNFVVGMLGLNHEDGYAESIQSTNPVEYVLNFPKTLPTAPNMFMRLSAQVGRDAYIGLSRKEFDELCAAELAAKAATPEAPEAESTGRVFVPLNEVRDGLVAGDVVVSRNGVLGVMRYREGKGAATPSPAKQGSAAL